MKTADAFLAASTLVIGRMAIRLIVRVFKLWSDCDTPKLELGPNPEN